MIYNIKGCHHQRHPFTYIGTILYGTIGGRSVENLLFISVFRVGEEFDSHHPLYFLQKKPLIQRFLYFLQNTSDIHCRTGCPGKQEGRRLCRSEELETDMTPILIR